MTAMVRTSVPKRLPKKTPKKKKISNAFPRNSTSPTSVHRSPTHTLHHWLQQHKISGYKKKNVKTLLTFPTFKHAPRAGGHALCALRIGTSPLATTFTRPVGGRSKPGQGHAHIPRVKRSGKKAGAIRTIWMKKQDMLPILPPVTSMAASLP